MELRGIDFGSVLGASGVQGFFGEGYWFHHLPFIGADFSSMTFVSKTATLFSRKGNMPLTKDYRPKNWFPSCVKVKFLKGLVLNSVGLSNPGLGALLGTGRWQKHKEPFMISVMSLTDTPQKRIEELRIMADMIGFCKKDFSAPFGLQVNLSCPNTGHNPREIIKESAKVLEILSVVGVPLMPKYSIAFAPISAIMELADNPNCDAICVSNTLPFGWQGIDWKGILGSNVSPLAKLGGGGLSGKALFSLVCEWIARLRDIGFTKPINGGGGILCTNDVDCYRNVGTSSVFLGSVAILRPWRVKSIISHAKNLKWR